jgi:hypothetical protein
LKYVQTTQSQQHNDKTYITIHLQQLDWILHAQDIQCKREKITRELTKTGHDTTVIKPTLQQHNNPRLDPPCPSALAQFLQRDEKKLTSINMKVSNLVHNQRTVLASKHYKIGSSAQPVDDLKKISKLIIYTQNNSPLQGVLYDHYIQSNGSMISSIILNVHPSIKRELRLAWVL